MWSKVWMTSLTSNAFHRSVWSCLPALVAIRAVWGGREGGFPLTALCVIFLVGVPQHKTPTSPNLIENDASRFMLTHDICSSVVVTVGSRTGCTGVGTMCGCGHWPWRSVSLGPRPPPSPVIWPTRGPVGLHSLQMPSLGLSDHVYLFWWLSGQCGVWGRVVSPWLPCALYF